MRTSRTALVLLVSFLSQFCFAQLRVVTSTTTLADLARQIGGEDVSVISITKASQDPHFVEAKPSYMVKLREADLLVSVGLGLEVGWIGLVSRGARNPKILEGRPGYFEAGDFIQPLGKLTGKVDRSQGDVHPEGNPHFHLDPKRFLEVAKALSERLAELDSKNAERYKKRFSDFKLSIDKKVLVWKKKVKNSKVVKVISYHKSLNYFFNAFGLMAVNYLEPKPGISPTAKHVIDLIRQVKEERVGCILNEDYFEETAARRVAASTGIKIVSVPVEVRSSYVDLIDTMVTAVEKCSKGSL